MGYPLYEFKPGDRDLDYLAHLIHKNSEAKGFWDGEMNFAEKIALIHSEASEALEEHRKGAERLYRDEPTGKPEGILPELADVMIRTLDLMYFFTAKAGISIDDVVAEKMAYNSTRPHMHGKAY